MRTLNVAPALFFVNPSTRINWTNATPSVPGVSANVTLHAWVALGMDGENQANSNPIFNYGFWRLHVRSNINQVNFRYDETVAHTAADSVGFGNLNRTLHHVVGVYQFVSGTSVNLSLYIDGALKQTTGVNVLPTTNYNASGGQVGQQSAASPQDNYQGKMMDIRVYHSALTANEISAMYYAGPNNYLDTAPVVWLPLTEMTGTTANDSSGNSNTGIITNPFWPLVNSRSQSTSFALATNRTLIT